MRRLRKGIYYEKNRNRYRVRVYKFNRATHCSYHPTLEEAEAALVAAKEARNSVQQPKQKVAAVVNIANLLGLATQRS